MEYTTLGTTGLEVSRICLGCNSFGGGEDWMLGPDESRAVIERALDLGITFFDTSNNYSFGESERILGDALADYDRDRLVVATKCFFQMDEANPNSGGLSRKAIEQELANSLDRLGMDTVDLYQIHRWDPTTPIRETMRTLADTVRRGSVRYLGASAMWAYQFATALHASDRLGLDRFVSMQNHYNLVYREEEREMFPLCKREGIGVIPWSPLARGFLTRPVASLERTQRGRTDPLMAERIATYRGRGGDETNARVEELADEKGVTMAQIALAWQLHRDPVDAPIIGTTSVEHLEDAVEALTISLSDAEMAYLEAPYEPKQVLGHT